MAKKGVKMNLADFNRSSNEPYGALPSAPSSSPPASGGASVWRGSRGGEDSSSSSSSSRSYFRDGDRAERGDRDRERAGPGRYERRDRDSSFRDREPRGERDGEVDSVSRADEADQWRNRRAPFENDRRDDERRGDDGFRRRGDRDREPREEDDRDTPSREAFGIRMQRRDRPSYDQAPRDRDFGGPGPSRFTDRERDRDREGEDRFGGPRRFGGGESSGPADEERSEWRRNGGGGFGSAGGEDRDGGRRWGRDSARPGGDRERMDDRPTHLRFGRSRPADSSSSSSSRDAGEDDRDHADDSSKPSLDSESSEASSSSSSSSYSDRDRERNDGPSRSDRPSSFASRFERPPPSSFSSSSSERFSRFGDRDRDRGERAPGEEGSSRFNRPMGASGDVRFSRDPTRPPRSFEEGRGGGRGYDDDRRPPRYGGGGGYGDREQRGGYDRGYGGGGGYRGDRDSFPAPRYDDPLPKESRASASAGQVGTDHDFPALAALSKSKSSASSAAAVSASSVVAKVEVSAARWNDDLAATAVVDKEEKESALDKAIVAKSTVDAPQLTDGLRRINLEDYEYADIAVVIVRSLVQNTLTLQQVLAALPIADDESEVEPSELMLELLKAYQNRTSERELLDLVKKADAHTKILDIISASASSSSSSTTTKLDDAALESFLSSHELLILKPVADLSQPVSELLSSSKHDAAAALELINNTVGNSKIALPYLVPVVSTALLSALFADKSAASIDSTLIVKYTPLLRRVIGNDDHAAVSMLTDAQNRWFKAGAAKGQIKQAFQALHANKIISPYEFLTWRDQKDTKSPSKPKTLLQVSSWIEEIQPKQREPEEDEEVEEEDYGIESNPNKD